MRCAKCGKALPLIGKFCNHCGAPKPQKTKNKKHSCLRLSLIVLAIPVAGFIVLTIIFGILDYRFNKALAEIQNNLVAVTAAKITGNSIITGKKIPNISLENIKNISETASQKLSIVSVHKTLENYRQVALIWTSEVALAAQNTQIWPDLGYQPGDVPMTLGDTNVQNFFNASIKKIAEYKKTGAEAIKNNDREAMRLIAAKLLVENHWLNAILHSTSLEKISLLATPAHASTQNPAEVPSVGKGVDVTCLVCNDPKVHWTVLLRQQYGCEVRCKTVRPIQKNNQEAENLTQKKPTDQPALSELSAFTYKDKPKRAICIGNNVGGVFCVEDAVQSTNEIAASAIGFADGAKDLSPEQWNSQYAEVDGAFLADGSVGAPASIPAITDGHLEGGMGTISTGEPIIPAQTKKAVIPVQNKKTKVVTPPPAPATEPEPTPTTNQPAVNFDDIPGLKALEEGLKNIDYGTINSQPPPVDENTLHRLGADDQGNDPCRWASDSDPNCN
jgi:hypothetical protein